MNMNSIIFKDPCDWDGPTCDPIPLIVHEWKVDVDGRVIQIRSMNRMLARFQARMRYPKAKRIRVIKRVY